MRRSMNDQWRVAAYPFRWAIADGELESVLPPLASDITTTIVGFTERAGALTLWHRDQ